MRHLSYNSDILVSGLWLILLSVPSFGSDRLTQEEDLQEQIRTTATTPQTAVPFSPESTFPHDIRVYILSFLTEQKDLLRIGTLSKSWRKAAAKIWENKMLGLSNKSLTVADYKALAAGIFPRLELYKIKLSDEGITILTKATHIQALGLRNNGLRITPVLVSLLSLPLLTYIDLSGNQFGAKSIPVLADTLKGLAFLTTLDLGYNQIGTKGATALAPHLKALTSLTTLDLGCNQIGTKGATALAPYLQGLTSITKLYLYGNDIGATGITALASYLQGLTSLDLSNNQIRDEGAKAIAEALKEMTCLTTLDLRSNQIGDAGKRALEDLKHSRPSLKLEY